MSETADATAVTIYDEHQQKVDELAEREDEIGAIYQALKDAAGADNE